MNGRADLSESAAKVPGSPLIRFIVLSALLSASCGARLMRLPSGPGAPASDIEQVIGEATSACRAASSMTAEVAVSGSVGGRRLRARLLVGLAAQGSARVEAFAFGQQIFILVARAGDATLLLTRDNRVLEHGRPAEILEAVAGVPLDAEGLRTTLLGCTLTGAGTAAGSRAGRQIGDDWRIVSDGPIESYFHRAARGSPWRLVAVVHRDSGAAWRAEYVDFEDNLPRTIRLVSSDAKRFTLRLALSQVELNAKLLPAAFEVRVPSSADPITIEELRRNGLLAGE